MSRWFERPHKDVRAGARHHGWLLASRDPGKGGGQCPPYGIERTHPG